MSIDYSSVAFEGWKRFLEGCIKDFGDYVKGFWNVFRNVFKTFGGYVEGF